MRPSATSICGLKVLVYATRRILASRGDEGRVICPFWCAWHRRRISGRPRRQASYLYLSIYLSIYLYLASYLYLSIYLSIYLDLCLLKSAYTNVHTYACMHVCLYIYLLTSQSFWASGVLILLKSAYTRSLCPHK